MAANWVRTTASELLVDLIPSMSVLVLIPRVCWTYAGFASRVVLRYRRCSRIDFKSFACVALGGDLKRRGYIACE